jgi:hypothetical protein
MSHQKLFVLLLNFPQYMPSAQYGILNGIRLVNIYAGGKIEKNEMGRACGAYGGGESCAQGFGGEALGEETTGETQT